MVEFDRAPADAVDLAGISRALVIKLRHHGDVLLTSSVFSVLKNRAPHLEIDALVYHDTREMLSLHPAISNLYTIDHAWKRASWFARLGHEWRLVKQLRARGYDLVIHLTESYRGAWLAQWLTPPVRVAQDYPGRRARFWKASFTHLYKIPAKPRHRVELHLDALRRIGVYPGFEERRLTLVPGADAEATVDDLLRRMGVARGQFVHLHPTSRWLFKCWDVEKYTALIQALYDAGTRVVLTAAPAEHELAFVRAIYKGLRAPVVDLAGQLTLKQLAALSARASCFVGVDSVPMHIAAAMGTPTVALFGPSGDLEWGPWMVRSRVLTSNHSCRPCGFDGCGQGKISECLSAIRVEQVLDAVYGVSGGA